MPLDRCLLFFKRLFTFLFTVKFSFESVKRNYRIWWSKLSFVIGLLFITTDIHNKCTFDLSQCKHCRCAQNNRLYLGGKIGQWHMSWQQPQFGKQHRHKQGDLCVNVTRLGRRTRILICLLLLRIRQTRCLLCVAKSTRHAQTTPWPFTPKFTAMKM